MKLQQLTKNRKRPFMKGRKRKIGAVLAALYLITCWEGTVYAATNKSGCESKGTVTAVYGTSGTAANGYYKKNGKVVVSYDMGQPNESCSDTAYQYVGITNKVETPQIDASEANVTGGGHVCNGHTSNTASWRHWFGLSGTVLYGMGTKNVGSVTVTEEEYNKCKYAIAGPSTSFGDGLESDGKFHWIVLYKKLPDSIQDGNTDDTAPTVTVSATPSGKTAKNPANGKTYGTEALLTATSTDSQSRPHQTKTFRWKNASGNITDWIAANSGNQKTITSTYTVQANGSYYAESQDQLGNSAVSKGATVDFIDRTGPTLMLSKAVNNKVTVNGKDWTSSTVTVNAAASDSEAGLSATPYCFDGVTWVSKNEYVVSQSGSYEVKVQDALGNVSIKAITVDNFDRQAPDVKLSAAYQDPIMVDEQEWTKEDAEVTVFASDYGCGLDKAPYSFDGGNTWTDQCQYFYSENGNHEIKIRDGLHNIKTTSIEIHGIDKIEPEIEEITMEPTDWKSGNAVVRVIASDNEGGCGLAEQAYSFDGGKSWTENNEVTLSQTETLEIQVRDHLGNIVEETFFAECVPDKKEDNEEKKPTDDDQDKKKDNETDGEKGQEKKDNKIEDGKGQEKKEKEKKRDGKEEKDSGIIETMPNTDSVIPQKDSEKNSGGKKKTSSGKSTATVSDKEEPDEEREEITKRTYQVSFPTLEEEKEPIEIEEYNMDDPKKDNQNKSFARQLCIGALLAILLLGLLGLLLWYLFIFGKYRVILYGREDGSFKRLGTLTITKKGEQHLVEIPDEQLLKINGNYYRIKVNPAYLIEREGEDIYLRIEERLQNKQVEKYIDFYVD